MSQRTGIIELTRLDTEAIEKGDLGSALAEGGRGLAGGGLLGTAELVDGSGGTSPPTPGLWGGLWGSL